MSKISEETYQITHFIRLLAVLPDKLKILLVRVRLEGEWTEEDIQQLTQAGYIVEIVSYDLKTNKKHLELILPKSL